LSIKGGVLLLATQTGQSRRNNCQSSAFRRRQPPVNNRSSSTLEALFWLIERGKQGECAGVYG